MLEVSWSELKTFQRCPKQWDYKYGQDLVRKRKQRPLFLGSWVHKAIETHYTQGDWKIGHQEYVTLWNQLFEEERIELRTKRGKLGPPIPELVERIMRSYVFYYRGDGWKVHAVEQKFKVYVKQLDTWFKGIIDLIVEDEEGLLWVVDHKTASTIPEATAFHAMDPQLMLYPWAAKQMWDLDVAGIIYNYVKSRPPTLPQLTAKTGQISRRRISTDYPTLLHFLKENGFDPRDFRDLLIPLRQASPFLRRYRLPREPGVTREILLDSLATAKRIGEGGRRVRVITRDCSRMCSYHDLCRAELNGFDTASMRKSDFDIRVHDTEEVDISDLDDDSEDEEE